MQSYIWPEVAVFAEHDRRRRRPTRSRSEMMTSDMCGGLPNRDAYIDERRKWAGYLCCSAVFSIRYKEKSDNDYNQVFDRKHHKIFSVPVKDRIEDPRAMIMDIMEVALS